ncbi:MAG: HD-GYP domain-containing protein [Rhizobacter sp.]
MIKRVSVSQLRPGMHLQRLEGNWLDHPFWRRSFVLGPAELTAIHNAGIAHAWIDPGKGLDAEEERQEALTADNLVRLEEPEVSTIEMPVLPEPTMPMELATPEVSEMALEEATRLCLNATSVLKKVFADIRLGRALDSEECNSTVRQVVEHVMDDPAALILVARLKNHDDYSHMHSVAVCALMVALARQLGLDRERMCEAGLAGLLHDVGKVLVPVDILNKPGPLTAEEYALVRTHVKQGYELLFTSGSRNDMVLDVCLHHHERMDGSGYPFGLKGKDLSLFAKMAAVCDVYDALTSKRPHRERMEPSTALRLMASHQNQFDSGVLQTFVKTVGIYPVGSLVRLHSSHVAIVVGQDVNDLLRPRVQLFYSLRTASPVDRSYVALAEANDSITSLETPESLGADVMQHLKGSPLRAA